MSISSHAARDFSFVAKLAALSLALTTLAGCGGGGGGGGSSSNTSNPQNGTTVSIPGTVTPTGGNPFSVSYMAQFNDAAATATRQSSDFAAQSFSWTRDPYTGSMVILSAGGVTPFGSISPLASTTYKSFSYASAKFDYALSHGLTGKGATVAVIDGGFNVNHEKLVGRIAQIYGDVTSNSQTLLDHGSHVASLIAGGPGGEMTGLAPDAKLFLATWGTNSAQLSATVEAAIQAGAIVQNNSWGYVTGGSRDVTFTSTMAAYGATALDKLSNVLVDANVAGYVETLRKFIQDTTRKGVVVFSASNDSTSTSISMPAGLPALLKASSDATEQALGDKLRAGWIVAVNAVPTFDSAGKIVSASRLSSKCFEMADSCLTGDGTTKGASATSNNSYSYGTGTSFVAPQITASVALLAQAFPTLPTTDLRKRLLASANNSFFTSFTGSTDFGNGVTHKYNDKFGQGFLDVKAALSPIGAVGTPTTTSAYGGVTPVSQSKIVAASNQGAAIQRSLSAATISLFDSLGGDFKVSAMALSGGTQRDMELERRFLRFNAALDTRAMNFGAPSLSSGGAFASAGGWTMAFGRADDVAAGFGAARAPLGFGAAPHSLQSLMPDTLSFGLSSQVSSDMRLGAYAFGSFDENQREFIAGAPSERVDRRKSYGAGIVQTFSAGLADLSLGASLLGEPTSMLGLQTSGALGGSRSTAGALDVGMSMPVMQRTRVFGSAQMGFAAASTGGLMRTDRPLLFSAFGLGVERTNMLRDDDAMAISVSQPLRTEAGAARIAAPSGRTTDGAILWQTIGVDLSPPARQLDWTMSYMAALGAQRSLRLATTFSTNAGNVAGAKDATILAGFAQKF